VRLSRAVVADELETMTHVLRHLDLVARLRLGVQVFWNGAAELIASVR